MGVRRRIRGEKLAGYPHPRFQEYRLRFGVHKAVFINAPMLANVGKCGRVKGPEPALVIFMNITAVYQEWLDANAIGNEEYVAYLGGVLDRWPDSQELSIWTYHRDLANASK